MLNHVRAFSAESIPRPLGLTDFVWPEAFRDAPILDVEIGCGVGWHPIRYATAHPERRLIAVEHTREKFARFESRLRAHENLSNLLPVHADAIAWITHALQPQTVDRFLILYPNPETKSASKRWMRMPFMARLIETLKPNGEIILATNSEVYFNEAINSALKNWPLAISQQRSFSQATNPNHTPRTHFEKKYLDRGETCHDVIFRKKEQDLNA